MIEAVIFDMDGVIIDTESIYKKIESKMYKDLGIKMSREEALSNMGKGVFNWWCILKEKYHLKEDPQALADYEIQTYIDYLFDDCKQKKFMDGIGDSVRTLKKKNYKIALASGSERAAVERVLDLSEFRECFDVTISNSDVKKCKPDPEIFLIAAEKLKVDPVKCLVIEDSYNGIKAAKTAGMTCLAYTSAPEGMIDYSLADGLLDHHNQLYDKYLK